MISNSDIQRNTLPSYYEPAMVKMQHDCFKHDFMPIYISVLTYMVLTGLQTWQLKSKKSLAKIFLCRLILNDDKDMEIYQQLKHGTDSVSVRTLILSMMETEGTLDRTSNKTIATQSHKTKGTLMF